MILAGSLGAVTVLPGMVTIGLDVTMSVLAAVTMSVVTAIIVHDHQLASIRAGIDHVLGRDDPTAIALGHMSGPLAVRIAADLGRAQGLDPSLGRILLCVGNLHTPHQSRTSLRPHFNRGCLSLSLRPNGVPLLWPQF